MIYESLKHNPTKSSHLPRMNDLIRKYRVDQPGIDGATFSTTQDPSGHFKVAWAKVTSFWKDYCELFSNSPDVTGRSCIYEVNSNEATLRIMMRFVHPKKTEIVTEEFLCNALAIIQEIIKQYISFSSGDSATGIEGDEDNLFITVVSKSTTGSANGPPDGNLRTEVEFKFPKCRTSQVIFNDKIIDKIIAQFRSWKVMSTLKTEPIGGWETIIQPMNTYFPIHGTRTSNDSWSIPLKMYKVSPLVPLPLEKGQELDNQDIYNYFEHTEHSWLKTRAAGQKSIIDKAPESIDFTPLMLSTFFSSEFTTFHFIEDGVLDSDTDAGAGKTRAESDISSHEPQDMVHHLIPMISKERLRNDMYWTELGRTLFNIFRRFPDTGFDIWNTYDPHPEPREDYNREKWEDFAEDSGINDHLSHRTLAAYAREDSPDRYVEWHKLWMEDSVKKSMSVIENDVAEVLYRYLWLDYMTVEGNVWYRFEPGGTRLTKMCGATKFLQEIPGVIKLYLNLRDSLNEDQMNIHNNKIKKQAQTSADIIQTIIKKLGTTQFQNAMVKQCYIKFHRDRVAQHFDTNPNIMAWSNVVTHCHGNEVVVRNGKLEDFMTKTTGISLETRLYTWEHPAVKELMAWFRQMFPEPDFLDYFLKICASFLYGFNAEKFFIIFSGKGDNGKSLVAKLIQRVLGDYAIDFPVEMLSGVKRDASGPSPELAQAQGSHVAFSQEPESSVPLKCGNIKRCTGGDRFFCRKNRDDGGSIEAMFKLVFVCNIIPRIEGADTAMVNRLRYLPFLSTYCHDAPDDPEEQKRLRRFPIDVQFVDKLKGFRRPMAWIMYQYFGRYRKEGLKSPKIVDEFTKRHWKDNDPYELFFSEFCIKTEEDDKLMITTVFNKFKAWFRNTFPTSPPQDVATMTTHLSTEKRLGDPKGRFWIGWKLRADDAQHQQQSKYSSDRKKKDIA
jgi:phage/plasmid-associated DNA primase